MCVSCREAHQARLWKLWWCVASGPQPYWGFTRWPGRQMGRFLAV